MLRDQIESINQNIKKLDEALELIGETIEGYKNLVSIKGIGNKSASILLSVIGDINDFEDEGKLSSYFGLVPRVRQSNETEHYGRITKVGSKLGRTTLVQCALVAIKYSEYLRDLIQNQITHKYITNSPYFLILPRENRFYWEYTMETGRTW